MLTPGNSIQPPKINSSILEQSVPQPDLQTGPGYPELAAMDVGLPAGVVMVFIVPDVGSKPGEKVYNQGTMAEYVDEPEVEVKMAAGMSLAVKMKGGISTLGVTVKMISPPSQIKLNNSISLVVIGGMVIVVTVVIVTHPVTPSTIVGMVSSIVSVLKYDIRMSTLRPL